MSVSFTLDRLPFSAPIDSKLCHYHYPADTRPWTNVGSMLGQRRRRWINIELTLAHGLVSAGYVKLNNLDLQCFHRDSSYNEQCMGRGFYITFFSLSCHSKRFAVTSRTAFHRILVNLFPANTRHWNNVDSMLGRRRRLFPHLKLWIAHTATSHSLFYFDISC